MKAIALIPLAAILALSACAGVKTFDQHLRQLEGKPVNDADLLLGHHADGEYRSGNDTVYVWQKQDVESIFGPAVTSGGYRLGSPSQAMGGSAMIWSGIQLNSCVIRATTNDGIIKKITFEGNPGGCETVYGFRRDRHDRAVSQ
jgi:hypothetical protein